MAVVNLLNLGRDRTPMSFFLALYLTDILDSLIESINGYAAVKLSQPDMAGHSRLPEWAPVGCSEMYKYSCHCHIQKHAT